MVMNTTIYYHDKESLSQLKSVTVPNMQESNKWKFYAFSTISTLAHVYFGYKIRSWSEPEFTLLSENMPQLFYRSVNYFRNFSDFIARN